jgi:hypothetical protein
MSIKISKNNLKRIISEEVSALYEFNSNSDDEEMPQTSGLAAVMQLAAKLAADLQNKVEAAAAAHQLDSEELYQAVLSQVKQLKHFKAKRQEE